MLQLKAYQERALAALEAYFAECRLTGDADTAFYATTRRSEWGQGIPYQPVTELPGLPYVCIRIPTGGGKTLVAAHAAGLAATELVQTEQPIVLWLVPSNPIREQTLAALRQPAHPYRRALEERLGACEVMNVVEALAATRARYTMVAVIVATMQAFRREDTEGLKVYEASGTLMDHFTGAPASADLERREDGTPVPSLANVLRLRRPIVIVDEAHNARTPLSFETLARFRPSCILEFSATPARDDHPSNVLYSVSAAELKVEDMIKLPILLETRTDWRRLLADAVARLNALDETASRERAATGEYIRPMMLIGAQPRRGTDPVTVEVVKQALVEDHRVSEHEIAVATGGTSDLTGVDVLSPQCPLRFVITVQQLREGWDCPFAYVLCSLSGTQGATAVEQMLGRVMRLPSARRKQAQELNQAYAFAASASFAAAAEALADALVQNGFEKQQARELIAAASPRYGEQDLPLFGGIAPEEGAPSVTVSAAELPDASRLPPLLAGRITVDPAQSTITLHGGLSTDERDALAAAFPTSAGRSIAHVLYERGGGGASVGRERPAMTVPLLAVRQGGLWEPFERSHFLDAGWDLASCDPRLQSEEWSPGQTDAQLGQVTITERGRAEYFLTDLHQQLALIGSERDWSPGALVHWLDHRIPHPDVPAEVAGVFLTGLINHLLGERRIPLAELVRDKYRLRDAVVAKINRHRAAAQRAEWQSILFGSAAEVATSPNVSVTFDYDRYPYQFVYRGPRRWKKHLFRDVGDLKTAGEEFDCACYLDDHPQVEVWVRNVSREPAFWLQTSTDKFYPDFVCRLTNGRYMAVEYKGSDRFTNEDSREKRTLGELWEVRSNGLCLFVMTNGPQFSVIDAKMR